MPKNVNKAVCALKGFAGALVILGACIGQPARAQESAGGAFTNASLQGTYIYTNSTGDVASFGPMVFDGKGGVTLTLEINLPCETPSAYCSRRVLDTNGSGTYSVEPDGTGSANVNLSTGTIIYSFVISEAMQTPQGTVATEVFAVGQTGGLAGQIVSPVWTRR